MGYPANGRQASHFLGIDGRLLVLILVDRQQAEAGSTVKRNLVAVDFGIMPQAAADCLLEEQIPSPSEFRTHDRRRRRRYSIEYRPRLSKSV